MEKSKEQIIKYKEEFKKRRSMRIAIFISTMVFLIVVGLFVLPVMDMLGVSRMVWAPFVYLIMFGVIISIAFVWRCPVCNGYLGDVFSTRYCSKCGFKFFNEKPKNKTQLFVTIGFIIISHICHAQISFSESITGRKYHIELISWVELEKHSTKLNTTGLEEMIYLVQLRNVDSIVGMKKTSSLEDGPRLLFTST